jgi:DNA-binding transcriptional LysR family regulator
MDLRTITTFNTIVEQGSFQAAAQQLNYAQSTITSHIKKLESSLGVTLFDRNQNMQLTEAGLLLKEQSVFLLKAFEALEKTLNEYIEGKAEYVRLGVMEPMASYRLPRILQKVYDRYPDVKISLHIDGSKVLCDLLAKDEIDAAICAASALSEGMIFESFMKEEVVLLVHQDHPLARYPSIKLAQIQDEKLVITNSSCPIRALFEQKMLEHRLIPNYKLEVSNMLALKFYVQAGYGSAVVPLVAVNPPLENTVTIPIEDFHEGLSVGILAKEKKQPGAALSYLLQLVKEQW